MKYIYDVVGLGYNSIDFLIKLPSFPKKNTKMMVIDSDLQGGGQVATALVALSRWGISTTYVGSIGDDENGKISQRELLSEGVDISGMVTKKGVRSQFAIILVPENGGERTILWKRDVSVNLKISDIKKRDIVRGRILHVDGHEIDAALHAVRWASEKGMHVVFDAEKVLKGTKELIRLTNSLITSEDFPEMFTGIKNKRKALKALKSLGPQFVATTLGNKGVLGFDGKKFLRIPRIPVQVMDTTGAGDVFHAGYIYGLLKGWNFSERLHFANRAAALKCRFLGGRKGIPHLKEINGLRVP